jgi:glycosyltransferase A (GT-A) superfamily protein (DUF2064 family)
LKIRSAVVFFVKNPDQSPVKTRLAERVGVHNAIAFYKLCLKAVANQAVRLQDGWGTDVYFATHEFTTNPYIPNQYPTLFQAKGGLGAKLITAINGLLEQYESVTILGSDAPALPDEYIIKGATADDPFALGPTLDGGYYLISAKKKLPIDCLDAARFSTEHALEDTAACLQAYGGVSMLPKSFDVDTFEDLKTLHKQLKSMPEQKELLEFTEKLLRE